MPGKAKFRPFRGDEKVRCENLLAFKTNEEGSLTRRITGLLLFLF